MIPALKSEFRKLSTIRSTYIITVLVAALVTFISFYIEGWRLTPAELQNPNLFSTEVTEALRFMVFGAVVAILLMSHEYRYNTIMHTLISSNKRGKVLFAKLVTASLYALFLTALVGILSPVMSHLGIQAHGHVLVPQVIDYSDLIWRSLFYGWGYSMAGLLLAVFIRSQVAAIIALFLIPSLAEGLIGFLLLKHNAVYLPFTALDQVIHGSQAGSPISNSLTNLQAAYIFGIYLIVGWIIAWVLFLRRDAN